MPDKGNYRCGFFDTAQHRIFVAVRKSRPNRVAVVARVGASADGLADLHWRQWRHVPLDLLARRVEMKAVKGPYFAITGAGLELEGEFPVSSLTIVMDGEHPKTVALAAPG